MLARFETIRQSTITADQLRFYFEQIKNRFPALHGHAQVLEFRQGIETCDTYLDRLDLDKFIAYALRYAVGAVIKRLEWLLETLGVAKTVTKAL